MAEAVLPLAGVPMLEHPCTHSVPSASVQFLRRQVEHLLQQAAVDVPADGRRRGGHRDDVVGRIEPGRQQVIEKIGHGARGPATHLVPDRGDPLSHIGHELFDVERNTVTPGDHVVADRRIDERIRAQGVDQLTAVLLGQWLQLDDLDPAQGPRIPGGRS